MSANDNSGAAPLEQGDPTQNGQQYQAPPPMWVSPDPGALGATQAGPAAPPYRVPTGAPGQYPPQGQFQPPYQPQDQPQWGGAPGSGWPVGPSTAKTGSNRRALIVTGSISVVVIIAIVIAIALHSSNNPAPGPAAAPAATPTVSSIPPVVQAAPTVTANGTSEPVGYFASGTAARNVGIPTFGTITSGMDVLTAIAAKGTDNSNATGDGKPNESVQIEKITIS